MNLKKLLLLLPLCIAAFVAFGCTNMPPPDGEVVRVMIMPTPTEGRIHNPGFNGVLEYEVFPWNTPPVVTETIFDDFSNFMTAERNWNLVNQNWGSRGVSPNNAVWSGNPAVVDAAGGTGGIVGLKSYGNYADDEMRRRQGASLISRRAFGAGKFEVRMKVVPRFGPCTAAWTFYSNFQTTWDTIEYSEIDIEAPGQGGGFRQWGGVTYEYFFADSESTPPGNNVNRSRTVVADVGYAYNDGEWHVFAFEWRTNEATGDVGVVWFHNGRIVAHTSVHVPKYTATFWVGNWFPGTYPVPEDPFWWVNDWLGIANFDEAWMFVDWIRITQYDDPTIYRPARLGGTVAPPFSADLGDDPLPRNNYVTNGRFVTASGANGALGWDLTNATRAAGVGARDIIIRPGGRMRQNISAQYNDFIFDLNVTAAAGSRGQIRAFVEFWRYDYPRHLRGPDLDGLNDGLVVNFGSNSPFRLTLLGRHRVGQSEAITFTSRSPTSQTLRFAVPPEAQGRVNNLYLVIEAAGRSGRVSLAEMFLVSNPLQ